MMIRVSNHLVSTLFRFHYHSQKVSQDPEGIDSNMMCSVYTYIMMTLPIVISLISHPVSHRARFTRGPLRAMKVESKDVFFSAQMDHHLRILFWSKKWRKKWWITSFGIELLVCYKMGVFWSCLRIHWIFPSFFRINPSLHQWIVRHFWIILLLKGL